MLLLKTATTCDGLNKKAVSAYYRSHTSKTMVIAVVGMDFEDSLDNCGIAIKLVFQRTQGAKVRQRYLVDKNGVIIKNKVGIH